MRPMEFLEALILQLFLLSDGVYGKGFVVN